MKNLVAILGLTMLLFAVTGKAIGGDGTQASESPASSGKPASSETESTDASAAWVILDERRAEGEQCIVCRQAIHEGDIVEGRYKGRTVHVAESMLPEFESDPDHYFYPMQARAALFDEAAMETPAMRTGWLAFGLYVLVGLVFGAACAYLALERGLAAWPWFFGGLLFNVLALATLLIGKARVAAAPPGLVKIPTTASPRPCRACGNTNHPSASACSGCGATLEPTLEPETARA